MQWVRQLSTINLSTMQGLLIEAARPNDNDVSLNVWTAVEFALSRNQGKSIPT